jgi:hypothetical protein
LLNDQLAGGFSLIASGDNAGANLATVALQDTVNLTAGATERPNIVLSADRLAWEISRQVAKARSREARRAVAVVCSEKGMSKRLAT